MKFDDTYIILAGFRIFEPMVLLTNMTFFVLALIYFFRLYHEKNPYVRQMCLFILSLGISMAFGAAGHAIQLQAGTMVFKLILLLMNFFSLLSAFFMFNGCFVLLRGKMPDQRFVAPLFLWLILMLAAGVITGDFIYVKVHAGIFLIYALYAHFKDFRKASRHGSRLVITGILISFFSLLAHSLHLSMHKWFNHKDLAHVIMIISLIVIFNGVRRNAEQMRLS